MDKKQFIDEFEDYLLAHDYHGATIELIREKFEEYDSLDDVSFVLSGYDLNDQLLYTCAHSLLHQLASLQLEVTCRKVSDTQFEASIISSLINNNESMPIFIVDDESYDYALQEDDKFFELIDEMSEDEAIEKTLDYFISQGYELIDERSDRITKLTCKFLHEE
jgi:hypothetical protein